MPAAEHQPATVHGHASTSSLLQTSKGSLVEEIETGFAFTDSVILISKIQFFNKKVW